MTDEEKQREHEITEEGNPAKPVGEAGEQMLERMNESHYEVTGFGLSFLHFRSDDQVLDIGCGGGRTLQRMAEKVPGGLLTGVDYSDVSVALSTQTNQMLVDAGRMTIVKGSVEALPFPDESFDIITTVESFYFWPNPGENLKEVRRVLKKGGTFMLIADIYGDWPLTAEQQENISEYHLFNPTREEFRELFLAAGFTDVVVHTMEGKSFIAVEGHH